MFAEPVLSASLQEDLEADYSSYFRNVEQNLDCLTKTTSVDQYVRLQKVGQGTFGEVFKVRHKATKQHYALKRIRMEQEKEGKFEYYSRFPMRTLFVLKKSVTAHVNPNERSNFRPQFFLVFEFCDHDLAGLSQQVDFSDSIKKAIMRQLLTGLHYLHKNNVLHRDLKAANILIDKSGVLKIADFGLARTTVACFRPDRPTRYTGRVVTLWYRPPEILLNDRHYGKAVDMWGAGCIMAELWTKFPIMQGDNELTQLKLIINLCGSITPEVWPGVERLEAYREAQLPLDIKRHVKERLKPKVSSHSAIDLIDKLLVLDPNKRITADDALSHDYFYEDPPPGDLRAFSRGGSSYLEFLSAASASSRVRNAPCHNRSIMHRPGPPAGPPNPGQRRPAMPEDNIHFDRVY
ncbi:unnamed protein product [Schistocephalus solidus]|uniref:Protein kinase domain-containing protein n=1 Tax=Schistocephalus solidus TaxID=70667 RepID=A0A183SA24_SCHSO|nr:unnamed protein product [Schistocephalus solidus]